MPRLILETREKEKPIILIAGDDNPLIPFLFDALGKQFKMAIISDSPGPQGENIYRIRPDSALLIKDLEEKIDYALIALSEKTNRKYLPGIFEKLTYDQAKVAVIINIREAELFFDVILEYNKLSSFYFLFLGDLYSEKVGEGPESEILRIIQKAIKNKSITFAGNDLQPIFPIYYKDALEAVSQILFSPPKKQKFYYLFYSHPQTVISAAHIIKRVENDLEIQYEERQNFGKDEKSAEEQERLIQSKIVTSPSYLDKYFIGFEKSLRFFQARTFEEEKKEVIAPREIIPKGRDIKFLGKAIFISIFLFITINIFLAATSVIHLKSSIEAFKKNDYKQVSKSIRNAKFSLSLTEPSIQILSKFAGILGVETIEDNYKNIKNSINLLSVAATGLSLAQKIPNGLDRAVLENLISDGIYLYFRAEQIRGDIQNETLNTLLTPDLAKLIGLSQIFPLALGFESEKNYLLLFQNNGELRPTGGFIGSVGELRLRGGKIEEFKITDVYEYDGKLKAHVEPHYVIRRYLQPHLYLRDSNFDPDFQNSASAAARLYNLETDKKVDGVIAINFEAVKRVVGGIGPIKLAQYNKTLDENNIFDFLQETIDDSFFPGSTQKKDVLEALFNQLILRIEQDENNFIKVARLLPKLMNEKHILFAFNGKSVQAVFSSNGYGGQLSDSRNPGEDQMNDYLVINEANIGVNKANIYVSRETDYEIALSKEGIKSKIKHIIHNEDENSKGYKAYIRILAPLGSSLTSIKIDGKEQKIVQAIIDPRIYENKVFKPPEGLEVDKSVEANRQVFGFIINVSPKTKQTIEIGYDNGVFPASQAIVKYSLLLIKQPGTLDYPFTLRFKYNDSYAPKEVENASLDNGVISISETLSGDKEFQIKLIKR